MNVGANHGLKDWGMGIIGSIETLALLRVKSPCQSLDLSAANWTVFDKFAKTVQSLDVSTIISNTESHIPGLMVEISEMGTDIYTNNVADLGVQTGQILTNIFVAPEGELFLY